MELSPATDYAIRELLLLAAFPTRRTSEEISLRLGIPESNVIAVNKRLAHAGWIHRIGGERGKYQLAVSLKEISMLSVMQIMEGGVHFSGHTDEDKRDSGQAAPKSQANDCLEKSQERVETVLNQVTLDQFTDRKDIELRPYPRVGLRLNMRNNRGGYKTAKMAVGAVD